jgi:hypothetical protein
LVTLRLVGPALVQDVASAEARLDGAIVEYQAGHGLDWESDCAQPTI